MKEGKLLVVLIGICLLLGWTSCSKEDMSVFGDDFEIPELTDDNTIQFTVDATGDWKQCEVVVGGGKVAIEWGDGRLQKVANTGDEPIAYKYGNSKSYRVRIWAEDIDFCNIGSPLLKVSNLRIGHFPKMKTLLINGFMDTQVIDLSSSCPNIETINVGSCSDLELLDMSQCSKLENIQVYTLPKLISLKLGKHPELNTVWCQGIDRLQSLSLKGLPALNHVLCNNNPQLSVLEFDNGTPVMTLRLSSCAFRSLDFLDQLPSLTELSCSSNQLTELDLTRQTLLSLLDCSGNEQLTSLLLPGKNELRGVECQYCYLDETVLNAAFSKLVEIPVDHPAYEKVCYIAFYKNPGERNCDKGILKGWLISKDPSIKQIY